VSALEEGEGCDIILHSDGGRGALFFSFHLCSLAEVGFGGCGPAGNGWPDRGMLRLGPTYFLGENVCLNGILFSMLFYLLQLPLVISPAHPHRLPEFGFTLDVL